MKKQWKILIICILIPLAVGAIAGVISQNSMDTFQQLNKPVLSPPGWLFPVVWTVLYILMGIASYLVITSGAPKEEIVSAIKLYALQLAVNFVWPILFFNFDLYLLSFIVLVVLWILIFKTITLFENISSKAAYFMIPYLVWVTFAGYLNLSIFLMN